VQAETKTEGWEGMIERVQIFADVSKDKRRELTIHTSDLGTLVVSADVAISALKAHAARQITEAEVGEILLVSRRRER
jgi:hypothetical protein